MAFKSNNILAQKPHETLQETINWNGWRLINNDSNSLEYCSDEFTILVDCYQGPHNEIITAENYFRNAMEYQSTEWFDSLVKWGRGWGTRGTGQIEWFRLKFIIFIGEFIDWPMSPWTAIYMSPSLSLTLWATLMVDDDSTILQVAPSGFRITWKYDE